jgi:RimJ/RimL family protein N-acetyltransferase
MIAAQPGLPGEWYQIAVGRKPTGELVGDCAFQRLRSDPNQAEIGFTFSPRFHGEGYATEAGLCLLDYLFGELGLHRAKANTDPDNHASIRLL